MLTANEIREVKFNRSMGGYKTNEVDDFLDRCAEAVDELTKINNENERKMQVLAETILDYRNQEDSIRSALISAQRMSESVISDARKQADDILAAAKTEAAEMHEKAVADTAAEIEELNRTKNEVADFKAKLLSIYREHLTLIGVLADEAGEAPAPASAPVEETPVEEEPPVVNTTVFEEPVMNPSDLIAVEDEEEPIVNLNRDIPDFSALELKDDE